MIERTDATPLATRVILIAVLTIIAAAHGMLLLGWLDPRITDDAALLLWLFTVLFVLRVIGQIVVAIRPQQWLPPMQQWNFIPYPILLPIQLIFIAIMVWIDVSFTSNVGISNVESPSTGTLLIAFSSFYVLAMMIRYMIRMRRHPDQRWFGGTIPIVFHINLGMYLYILGRFYVFT